MTILELQNVTVNRGGGPVISDVSLSVHPGTVTTLVGPNGAGKTSLLESISGVVTASSGKIILDGTDITTLRRSKRSKLGLVHVEQGRAIFPSLTVRENIKIASKTTVDFDRVISSFPELDKRIDSPTGLLSGGEQQMVVLARALAAKPKILLIDEMSLGLAPVVFLRLMPLVREIAEDGVGVLLVEQFAHLALKIATDAMVISGGKVTYYGQAATLEANPGALRSAYLG